MESPGRLVETGWSHFLRFGSNRPPFPTTRHSGCGPGTHLTTCFTSYHLLFGNLFILLALTVPIDSSLLCPLSFFPLGGFSPLFFFLVVLLPRLHFSQLPVFPDVGCGSDLRPLLIICLSTTTPISNTQPPQAILGRRAAPRGAHSPTVLPGSPLEVCIPAITAVAPSTPQPRYCLSPKPFPWFGEL